MGYPIGRFGFTLSAVMIRKKNKVRAELYISGEKAKGFFTSLKEQREEIEGELEYHLEWEELPKGRDCRVAYYLNDADPGGCPGRCWNSAAARVTFYATCSTSVASPRPRR